MDSRLVIQWCLIRGRCPAPKEDELYKELEKFGAIRDFKYKAPKGHTTKSSFNAKVLFESEDSVVQCLKWKGPYSVHAVEEGRGHCMSNVATFLKHVNKDTKVLKMAKRFVVDNQLYIALDACKKYRIGEINLRDNQLTDMSAEVLVAFAKENAFLTHVDLRGNPAISSKMLEILEGTVCVNVLLQETTDLDTFRSINERPLGKYGGEIIANFLASEQSHMLSLLGVGKCNLPFETAAQIMESICTHPNMENLEIYCNVPDPRWATISVPLIRKGHLKSLDLGRNGISDDGAIELATALRGSQLLELHLDYNTIGNRGGEYLLECIPHSSLHTLWLHGNAIGSYLNDAIESAIRKNRLRLFPRPSRDAISAQMFEMIQTLNSELADILVQNTARATEDVEIAELCIRTYNQHCPDHARFVRGQSVLAAIIQYTREGAACVAFGLGTRFLDSNITSDIERICDSHAEVIARRAFQRYMMVQGLFALQTDDAASNSLLMYQNGRFAYRDPETSFVLYTSTAPCGSACGLQLDPSKTYAKGGGQKCPLWTHGHRKTCSDKIRRWCKDGLLGKRLRDVFPKVILARLVIGRRYTPRCDEVFSSHVHVTGTEIRLEHLTGARHGERGDSDTCIAWCLGSLKPEIYDGKTGIHMNTLPTTISRWWMRQEIERFFEAVKHMNEKQSTGFTVNKNNPSI